MIPNRLNIFRSGTRYLIATIVALTITGNFATAETSNNPAFVPPDQLFSKPYSLDEMLSLDIQLKLVEIGCPMTPERLKNFTIGEWRVLPFEKQAEAVCALVLLSRGPEMSNRMDFKAANISAKEYFNATRALLIIVEGHRPPSNLHIGEALVASLVAIGLIAGDDALNLRRAIYE